MPNLDFFQNNHLNGAAELFCCYTVYLHTKLL